MIRSRPHNSLVDITVRLPGRCRCGAELATIDVDAAELSAAAALRCSTCSAPRGWLSHRTLDFITDAIRHFGVPTDPIIIRRGGGQ